MISKKLLIGSMIAAMLAVPFGVAESVNPCTVINGTEGDDILVGTSGCNKINGDHGDDEITPGSGPDRVNGDDGNDTIYNPDDNSIDIINCEGGYDTVSTSGANNDGDRYRNCENFI